MSSPPMPPKETTARELVSLARRIERYSAQRRKLRAKLEELDGQIREARRMLNSLAELVAAPPDENDLRRQYEQREPCCLARSADAHAVHSADCSRMQG